MKKIKLSNNQFALVDDRDFEYLNQWKWSFDGRYATRSKHIRLDKNEYKSKKIYLHRLLVDKSYGVIDHINLDSLDNRRSNLRVTTVSANIRNGKLRKNNKSGITGVYFDKNKKKWLSQIMVNRKHIHLGNFIDIKNAILSRKQAEETYYAT